MSAECCLLSRRSPLNLLPLLFNGGSCATWQHVQVRSVLFPESIGGEPTMTFGKLSIVDPLGTLAGAEYTGGA
jgi:hypothetical protein